MNRLALAALVAAGIAPWLFLLDLGPLSRDAAVWINSGAPGPRWLHWTFETRHFHVGWRPVTALSFTADHLIGGWDPTVYRATDLGLFGLVAVLLAALCRSLGLPAWTGLVAAAVWLAHPVQEQIVPHLARRSYTLATALGLAGLLAVPRSTLLAGTLLATALAANEGVAGMVVVAPLVAWTHRRSVLPILLPIAALLVARTAAIGTIGGYDAGAASFLEVATRNLGALTGVLPIERRTVVHPAVVPFVALGATLVAVRIRDRRVGIGLVWLAATTALLSSQGVWFPRQVALLVPPLALLLAAAHPAVVVSVAALLLASPITRGVDPELVVRTTATHRVLADLSEALADVPDGSDVDVVVPRFTRDRLDSVRARKDKKRTKLSFPVPLWWAVPAGREVTLHAAGVVRASAGTPAFAMNGTRMQLQPGTTFWTPGVGKERVPWKRWGTVNPRSGADTPYLYVHDGVAGRLLLREDPSPKSHHPRVKARGDRLPADHLAFGPNGAARLVGGQIRPDVLLVVWDTVRADRMSTYGYARPTTPNVDAWAADATVFTDVVSAGSTTVPAHASMFTGLLPSKHGTHNRRPRLDADHHTLAEHLADAGYATWAFGANPYLDASKGITQGFATLEHPWDRPHEARALLRHMIHPDDQSTEIARKVNADRRRGVPLTKAGQLSVAGLDTWLSQHRDESVFAFVNLMEAHRPFVPGPEHRSRFLTPEDEAAVHGLDASWDKTWAYTLEQDEYTDAELALLGRLYDASLSELDDRFAQLLAVMEAHGRDPIVILTADHGEHLGEHHRLDHQYSVYDELLRIPLIVKRPPEPMTAPSPPSTCSPRCSTPPASPCPTTTASPCALLPTAASG